MSLAPAPAKVSRACVTAWFATGAACAAFGACSDGGGTPAGTAAGGTDTTGTNQGGAAGNGGAAMDAGSGGAREAGEGGAAGPGDAAIIDREWALWPMPNPAGTGLPNPQSYDTSMSGVVVDRVTGLMWQRAIGAIDFFNWSDGVGFCGGLALGGSSDWRMPTFIELGSLFDWTSNTYVNADAFPQAPTGGHWTASPGATNPTTGSWVIFFASNTSPNTHSVASRFRVRCVRGGPAPPTQRYLVQAETVLDNATKLTWQRAAAPMTYDYAGATMYCSDLDLVGQTDWRLPSLWEGLTLFDIRVPSLPPIDRSVFPDTQMESFWTSTGWKVDFTVSPGANGANQAALLSVRCVR